MNKNMNAQKDLGKEKPKENIEPQKNERRPDEHEVKEAKISVGIEAGEILEGEEVTSGEVSESEQKRKEGYSGGNIKSGVKGSIKKPLKMPTPKQMKAQVEVELKKEIKQMKKKIRKVVRKKGSFDAYQVNTLMAQLRKLQELLSTLFSMTADAVKDLWLKYVKNKV